MVSTISNAYLIDGRFSGFIYKEGEETLFLCAERLTEKNTAGWAQYKNWTNRTANLDGRDVLSNLVKMAGTSSYPDHESVKEYTGFTTEKEHGAFEAEAIARKKTKSNLGKLLALTCVGANHMYTVLDGDNTYIAYATRNPAFHIPPKTDTPYTLKGYIERYSDILITVGSNFSFREDSFHNRGISRNPYWVFKQKYSGLSMKLHGFTAAVAKKYFPKKTTMAVMPTGSMLSIIKKSLLPGEGYSESAKGKVTDITAVEVTPDSPEGDFIHIPVSVLVRIYKNAAT